MTPFPLALQDLLGHWPSYLVYTIIGFAFGYVLEIAGFGKSTKLAAQFYFKEMTVLKVMFGAIIVAMALIFISTGIGLLDYNLIWVNPTYLWPGIVGGLLMGVGFIIGGFCPGTSLVSAATLKIDGIVFALGVFFGIFMFGETVGFYEPFWHSSYLGRFTLPELFGVDTGVVVLAVILMALGAFAASELAERVIGKRTEKQPRWRFGAAGALMLAGVATIVIGQPTNGDRWTAVAPEQEARLTQRQVQIHPGELLQLMDDRRLITNIIDVRSESDFNQFHIRGAQHIPLESLLDRVDDFHAQTANTVFVLVSNDEAAATEGWRQLIAENVPTLYLLSGGINGWLETFSDEAFRTQYRLANAAEDQLAYSFPMSLGERYPAASPNPDVFQLEFTPLVQLAVKRGATSGGCG